MTTAMIWAIAVVVIVAILGFTEVRKAKHRARHGITTDVMGNERPVLPDEVKREVEELRERVRVLERIATDDPESKRLSAEIENLRDE